MTSGKLTGAAVAEHNSRDSCWVIVHGKAYDVTDFLPGTYTETTIATTL
jgi:L-lactate dehydrogenase (cytochrome)